MRQRCSALTSLRLEAMQVLARLVDKHPELAAEAEELAAAAIVPQRQDQVEAAVSKRLCGLDIDDLGSWPGCTGGGMCSRGRRLGS